MRWCILLLCCVAFAGAACAQPDIEPALMLARRAPADIDPADWLVSEKLDGVRAVWDGRTLRFRNGRPIAAPAWFLAPLPGRPLDGELWIGRRCFEKLSGIVRREMPNDAAWRSVRYMVFDLPGEPGDFGARSERLRQVVREVNVGWLQAVGQMRLADRATLKALFDAVVTGGGEGLMLHRADALWVPGRSDALLKLTPFLDAEATVVGYVPGKGRHRGRLGALEVRAADGRRFRIGSGLSDAVRASPPAPGSEITYRYRELTARGLPRFPVFVRIRDLP